jgi:NAD(P)-dependent dehydrogenase (short-subunit alcohol dehydrogenase family)
MALCHSGKKALVTGAGRSMGRGIAKALALMGAEVYALDIIQDNLDSLKTEVPRIHPVCVDLADWEATRKVIEKLDAVDFLVNNAALNKTSQTTFLNGTEHDLDQIYKVNFKAVVNVSQMAARKMVECGKPGVIVNISGVFEKRPLAGWMEYCSMKAALHMLTKVMALELGPHNIRVVSVRPTLILSEIMTKDKSPEVVQELVDGFKAKSPLGKIGEIEDVVNTVVFLLSDKAALITGSAVDIDAGYLVM